MNNFNEDYKQEYTAAENAELNAVATSRQNALEVNIPPRSAGQDITLGVMQSPRHIIRGAAQGVNEILDIGQDLDRMFGFPELQLTNPQTGKVDLEFVSSDTAKQRGLESLGVPVPDAPKVQTVTGNIIEDIAQFAAGFKGAGKILKGAKGARGAVAKGALGDVLAFDESEARLSNLIEKVPELKNDVTGYLQATNEDSFAEGKLKQAIEGVALGAAGEALFKAVKGFKKIKTAKDAGIDVEQALVDSRAMIEMDNEAIGRIGDPNDTRYILEKFHKTPDVVAAGGEQFKRTSGKLKKAANEVAGVGDITKKSLSNNAPDIQINFARINGDEDVKKLMQEMANRPELSASINKARRGKQSTEQTLKGAEDISGFDELLTRRQGEAFNDQQIIAARKVYYSTTEKLLEIAERAASPQATEIDQFMFRKMLATHQAVQKELLGARAEAGRALRAWAIPVGGDARASQIEEMLNQFGGIDASKQLAQRLSAASKTGMLDTSKINKITRLSAFARTVKGIESAWMMGILTSPRTHVVNILSNINTGALLAVERYGQVLTGGVDIREANSFFIGYFGSVREAFANAKVAWQTGEVGMGLGKIDLPPVNPGSREMMDPEGKMGIFSKAIDYYSSTLNKYVGGGLAFGDEFAKTMAYNAEMRALAARSAASNGLTGQDAINHMADILTNPDNIMRESAREFANYATFTKQLGKQGQQMQNTIAAIPGARFVVPFIRTPTNIFKFTFERTPLGYLSQNIRDDIAAGGFRKSRALTRMGMGTTAIAVGADMALNGEITGGGPRDRKVRDKLYNTGWRPYSIKINGEYYSYARFDPFATWLGMSADMSEILSNYDAYDVQMQEDIDGLVTAGIISISNQVVGKTFMQGISDVSNVLADPKRYGEQFLQKFAGSFIPNITSDIERMVNPETEQVFNMVDAIKKRIPGLSEDVSKRYNVYGEVIQSYYPSENNIAMALGERASQLFNPVYYSDSDTPPQYLDQFFLKSGLDGVSRPSRRQTFRMQYNRDILSGSVDLGDYPHIYERFFQLRGEMKLRKYHNTTLKDYLTKMVENRTPSSRMFYDRRIIGTDVQQNIINQIVNDYDQAIRDKLIKEYPVLEAEIAESILRQRNIDAQKRELFNQ